MAKRPVLKVYNKNLSPDGHIQAHLHLGRSDASLDICGLSDGRIRFDIWEEKERAPCSVRVNIREEQSFHPAMIVMPHELDILQRVKEHRPNMSDVRTWDLEILGKLNKMGLIDGKISAVNNWIDEDGDEYKTYDCRMMEITTAGQYILDRAKERDL